MTHRPNQPASGTTRSSVSSLRVTASHPPTRLRASGGTAAWCTSPRFHRGVARLSGPLLRLAARTRPKLSGGGWLSLGVAREYFVHAPRPFPPQLTSSLPVRCAPIVAAFRLSATCRSCGGTMARYGCGSCPPTRRRCSARTTGSAPRSRCSSSCSCLHRRARPRLTPTTHPATLARHAPPCVAVWRVVTTRIRHCHAPPLLASGADGATAAAEQAGHHLLRLCALRVGCIGPATQPPAWGVGRSCGRPCLGRLQLALCSRWRPSTPSFAPLLLQSVVPPRLVSFGTLWLPFLCFSWVQGPGGCVRECGACQRACLPRRRCPDARAFVRVRALYIFSPRVFCHSFLWKLALHAGPAATGGL